MNTPNTTRQMYTVTILRKHMVNGRRDSWTVEVEAVSKKDANETARYEAEREGHCFTKSDAATFTAVLSENQERDE